MRTISTGHPSTLGTYLILAETLFGEESGGATFLRQKISESPNGKDEEVIADERQMMMMLAGMK